MPKKSYTLAYFREMVIFGVTHPAGEGVGRVGEEATRFRVHP